MNKKDFLKKYLKQSKKGFTMVEMIAAIVIMSIISTATVSIFLSVQTTVRDTSKLTTEQYTTTQMEKFIRNEFQTASKIDVHDFVGGLPDGVTLGANDEYLYYDPATKQLTFMICDAETNNLRNRFIIDSVSDVSIDICPVSYSEADPTGMPYKLVYSVETPSYTYSGGIVLGNSKVGESETFESAAMIFAESGGKVAHIHWHKNDDPDFEDEDDLTNELCITFHAVGSQVTP